MITTEQKIQTILEQLKYLLNKRDILDAEAAELDRKEYEVWCAILKDYAPDIETEKY